MERRASGEFMEAGRRLNTALCPCTPRRGAPIFHTAHCFSIGHPCTCHRFSTILLVGVEVVRQYFAGQGRGGGKVQPIDQLWTLDTG